MKKQEDLKYSEAIAEIEEIIKLIDDDLIDLDELIVKVKRATELIYFCKKQILNAENEINAELSSLREISGNEEKSE
ncbi:MAG: exodeoxyribonuclease VII small subunit [Bacteroidales bacterium]|jgi:exodeoxyribonuclease VII small subunit|nr:exodeoxyribonuclease VII small subunit [Bacteroidales bacterium]